MMSRRTIDQFSDYNQIEVKKDLGQILNSQKHAEITKQLNASKAVISARHEEILSKITPHRLAQFIAKEFMTSKNIFKSTAEIRQNPSYTLMVQLCLDRYGYSTPIDSDYGDKTKEGVRQFLMTHGSTNSNDTIAGTDFFTKMYHILQNNDQVKGLNNQTDESFIENNYNHTYKPSRGGINLQINGLNQPKHKVDILTNSIEALVDQHFAILGSAYIKLKPDFGTALHQIATQFPQLITAKNIYRTFWLIHKENPNLNHNTRTSIGQVGRSAFTDAMTHRDGFNSKVIFDKWKGVKNISYIDQIKATIGYAKLCGIYEANNDNELGIAFTNYNLGPYRKRNSKSSRIPALENQASDIKDKAKIEGKYDLAALHKAELQFYLPKGDYKA